MPSSKPAGTTSPSRSLLRMKKLKPHTVNWAQIDRFLVSAEKKLASAQKILAFDEESLSPTSLRSDAQGVLGVHVQPRVPGPKPTGASHRNHRIRAGAH